MRFASLPYLFAWGRVQADQNGLASAVGADWNGPTFEAWHIADIADITAMSATVFAHEDKKVQIQETGEHLWYCLGDCNVHLRMMLSVQKPWEWNGQFGDSPPLPAPIFHFRDRWRNNKRFFFRKMVHNNYIWLLITYRFCMNFTVLKQAHQRQPRVAWQPKSGLTTKSGLRVPFRRPLEFRITMPLHRQRVLWM